MEKMDSIETDAVPIPPRPNSDKTQEPPSSSPPSSRNETMNPSFPGAVINIANSAYIHLGNQLIISTKKKVVYEGGDKAKPTPKCSKPAGKSPSVLQLMRCKDEISHKYMQMVSENLGESWRGTFRRMGYKDGFIETMTESHKEEGISEVIYQMLLDWIRNPEDGKSIRSLGELSAILWDDEKYELVQQLANFYQNSQQKQV